MLDNTPPMAVPAQGPSTTREARAQQLKVMALKMRRNTSAMIGLILLVAIFASAIFAPWLATHDYTAQDLGNRLAVPSAAHWFGTDELGRDVFSRVLVAIAASLRVAVVSVALAAAIGVLVGVLAGYRGGWIDTVVMRVVDVMFAFPVLLLALAIVAVLGPGITTTMLAIGIVYIPIFARVARASALGVRVEPFVAVSRSMGTGDGYILVRHILPNIAGPLIVQLSLSLAFAILAEAALSFLGLGIQPPQPSLGRMIFDAQGFVTLAWWMAVFPGVAIFVMVERLSSP